MGKEKSFLIFLTDKLEKQIKNSQLNKLHLLFQKTIEEMSVIVYSIIVIIRRLRTC